MMKQTTRLAALSALIALGGGVFIYSPSSAALNTAAKQNPFCTSFETTAEKTLTGITTQAARLTAARDQRTQNYSRATDQHDQEIVANRVKWDEQRQSNFSQLEQRARTPGEKAAVTAYKTSLVQAIDVRRGAYDATRIAYRDGVSSVLSSHQNAVGGQVQSLITAANSAVNTARTSCQSSPSNGTTARVQFKASLRIGREAYRAQRKTDAQVPARIQDLARQRTASFRAADDAFDASAKTARDKLKAAFKNTEI